MLDMYNPLVSIVIPVYNGSNYLAKAINSALAQTYENIEILVINDGSTDNGATRDMALSYGDKIRYFEKENGGISSALNCGISNMKGEYFSWLSHDDEYFPNKIQSQIDILNRNNLTANDKVILHGSGILIDANGDKIVGRECSTDAILTGIETFCWCKKNKKVLNGLSLLIPKKAFDECGLFAENIGYQQDVFIWYKMMFADYNFILHLDKIVKSRVHSNQTTVVHQDWLYKDSVVVNNYLYDIFQLNFEKLYGCVLEELKYLSSAKNKESKELYCKLMNLIKDNDKLTTKLKLELFISRMKGNIYCIAKKIYHKLFKKRA